VKEREIKREKESVFIPNGESLETATLHGSVFYLECFCMTLFATFGAVFWCHWVSFGPHSIFYLFFMEYNISLGPTISFLFSNFLFSFFNFFFYFIHLW